MQPVEIYTSPTCGFCHAAKRLLSQKGVNFSEVNIYALERAGKLDALLDVS